MENGGVRPLARRSVQQDCWEIARELCERAEQAHRRAQDNLARVVEQRSSRQAAAGHRADDARRRARLTIQQLWLSFWALGGDADVVDLDGFLAGLIPLHPHQQVVLLQVLKERRLDLTRERVAA